MTAGATASGTANVSFVPPADPGSSPITAYQANCGGVNQGRVRVADRGDGADERCGDHVQGAGAQRGRVRAVPAAVPFTPGVPWGPTSVTGGPGPVTGSVVVNWNAAQTNGAAITSYTVTCVPWSSSFPTRSVSVGGAKRTAQVNGLQPGSAAHLLDRRGQQPRAGQPRVAQPVGTIKPKS